MLFCCCVVGFANSLYVLSYLVFCHCADDASSLLAEVLALCNVKNWLARNARRSYDLHAMLSASQPL